MELSAMKTITVSPAPPYFTRYWICRDRSCTGVTTCSAPTYEGAVPDDENKCRRPGGPGGYWYCSYIELVPKEEA